MAKVLSLVNGIPRMVDESGSPAIYDVNILVVSGTPADQYELQGPIDTGTPITLPESKTYLGEELEVYLNDIREDELIHYNQVGSGTKTQISFLFDLIVGDRIRFRIDRGA